METLRFRVWSNKMANSKLNSAPQLKILPPTQSVFELHVARAHLQAAIWKGSLKQSPLDLDPLTHGWSNGTEHIGMVPLAIPNSVSPVPEEILKMINSGCSSMSRCSSMHCSCSSARLSCSLFCSCHADESCMNKQTIVASQENDENESSESSSFNLYEVRKTKHYNNSIEKA